jgi:hypothetical protein
MQFARPPPRTMHFAKWTRALDWLPGDRSTDHFPTLASQNCQREVVAGKGGCEFFGIGHLEVPFQRQIWPSVHGTPHAKNRSGSLAQDCLIDGGHLIGTPLMPASTAKRWSWPPGRGNPAHGDRKVSGAILWRMKTKQKMELPFGDLITAAYQGSGSGQKDGAVGNQRALSGISKAAAFLSSSAKGRYV